MGITITKSTIMLKSYLRTVVFFIPILTEFRIILGTFETNRPLLTPSVGIALAIVFNET